jgi:hypothetical protein
LTQLSQLPYCIPVWIFFATVLKGVKQKKSGKTYEGWFTITAMNMSAGKEIEIIFNRLKERIPENTTIIDLINRNNEHENISR